MDYFFYLAQKVWGRVHPSDDTLEILQLQDIIVKIGRGKWGSSYGFIKSFNERYIILQIFNCDILGLDGFAIVRKKDITSLKPSFVDIDDQFFKACIRVRDQTIEIPPIPSDIIMVLNHIKENHDGICIIYIEEVDNNAEIFGMLGEIGEKYLKIKKIDGRSIRWRENYTLICIDEITKITWDGQYHKTLTDTIKFIDQSDQQEEENDNDEDNDDNEDNDEEIIIANPIYPR